MSKVNKVSVTCPETHTDILIKAMAKEGAGQIGNYSHCAHITKIMGNYMPEEGSNPYSGVVGEMAKEPEDKIEMVCSKENTNKVIDAIIKSHPYETPTIDIYEIEFYTK